VEEMTLCKNKIFHLGINQVHLVVRVNQLVRVYIRTGVGKGVEDGKAEAEAEEGKAEEGTVEDMGGNVEDTEGKVGDK